MGATIDIPNRIIRDRWGRAIIDAEIYLRPSTLGKTLDDQGGLMGWGKRMVAFGLADRPDLLAMMATIDRDDRKAVNELCERAAEAGGATVRRELGTALHRALELSWTDPMYTPPAQFAAHIAAVNEQLRRCGLAVVEGSHERFVINEQHQCAWSFDLLVTDGDQLFIADIKTGASVELGGLGFAVQLACYANADWYYDGTTRTPIDQLSKSTGVIIHVEPTEPAVCNLHWLDLEVGAEALDLALEVRQMRKAKPLAPIVPVAAVKAEQLAEVHTDWREWITGRIRALMDAGHGQLIVDMWPDDVPTLKSQVPYTLEQEDQITRIVSRVERSAMALFPPDLSVQTSVQEPVQVEPVRRPTPDDVGTVDDDQIQAARASIAELPDMEHLWLSEIVADCREANYPIALGGLGGKPSARRHAIVLALLALSMHADDDITRGVVCDARNEPNNNQPLGELVGSMTLVEAHRVISTCDKLSEGTAWFAYGDDGTVAVNTDINNDKKDNQ